MTNYDPARISALLDDPHANFTEEQRAEVARRRRVLGSPDETYALNRAEAER